jgi:hypothetical protein
MISVNMTSPTFAHVIDPEQDGLVMDLLKSQLLFEESPRKLTV